ncbi:hypothetical protein SAMN05444003_2021 [Cognatiyoonia sediminum]|uniref:Uncharacterized protein n=1 Tax=Cognatiyoonia sediminum TaxID=1508389 RepID=A0A1M5Q453_9RHOB|nr:hypothetical protein SAMN05444003_2021 [Cognatiyoonia sediminum]
MAPSTEKQMSINIAGVIKRRVFNVFKFILKRSLKWTLVKSPYLILPLIERLFPKLKHHLNLGLIAYPEHPLIALDFRLRPHRLPRIVAQLNGRFTVG